MAAVKIKVTPEMLAATIAATDWARVDATTDEDIARHIAEDEHDALRDLPIAEPAPSGPKPKP